MGNVGRASLESFMEQSKLELSLESISGIWISGGTDGVLRAKTSLFAYQ